jgi:hypothetical protein
VVTTPRSAACLAGFLRFPTRSYLLVRIGTPLLTARASGAARDRGDAQLGSSRPPPSSPGCYNSDPFERLALPHSGHWFAVNPDARAGGVRTFRCERRCRHHSARVFFQRVHCEALSFMQINSPAWRRSRLSSPLQTEEIQENLSLYMRTFGKYLAISGNIECHFPLSDRRLRRANRRTI